MRVIQAQNLIAFINIPVNLHYQRKSNTQCHIFLQYRTRPENIMTMTTKPNQRQTLLPMLKLKTSSASDTDGSEANYSGDDENGFFTSYSYSTIFGTENKPHQIDKTRRF